MYVLKPLVAIVVAANCVCCAKRTVGSESNKHFHGTRVALEGSRMHLSRRCFVSASVCGFIIVVRRQRPELGSNCAVMGGNYRTVMNCR